MPGFASRAFLAFSAGEGIGHTAELFAAVALKECPTIEALLKDLKLLIKIFH